MAQMLSLLCPFLVAVRILAEMLMPLEMRFPFDGREYGNGYLRVPERLEVDDVEDTNDPQRGPVAVMEGWRLVRPPGRRVRESCHVRRQAVRPS